MKEGKPFEVSKEVYERAKANSVNQNLQSFYMTKEDEEELFCESIRRGCGLYNCKVYEEDGKYICTWEMGSSCD